MIIQYAVFSSTLSGAEYGEIAEQLKEHASQELAGHDVFPVAQYVHDIIVVDGIPRRGC